MAFTLTEAQAIRTYLGYADTNLSANAWLTTTMGQLTVESESAVRALLSELSVLDVQFATVRAKRLQVSEIEGITLLGPGELRVLKKEAARLCNRIGVILGIQVREDIYGSSAGGGLMCMG